MSGKSPGIYLFLGAFCFFLFGCLILAIYQEASFLSINQDIYTWSQKIKNSYSHFFATLISLFGNKFIIVPAFVGAGLILLLKKEMNLAMHLIGIMVIAAFLAYFFKNTIAFPRPGALSAGASEGYAFPSRHVTLCATYTIFLSLVFCNQMKSNGSVITVACIWIFLQAISRIILQVHWFIDVIGGTLLGSSCGFLGAYTFLLTNKNPEKIKFALKILLMTFLFFMTVYLSIHTVYSFGEFK
ncbi:phosphatase PAP2 family protein [Legionella lytica]|uniref:undecaprenyl-diphosphate phosphatase n=1 Tax=Legionella lytica TaxID=96232 RepID=A0ABW8D9H3_9GAMM